jgi:cation diffusion facilitator family transporter
MTQAPAASETSCASEKSNDGCGCEAVTSTFDGSSAAYRRILWVIVAMNAAIFVVEIVAGQLAGSVALQADALDFLGDTATYAITLLVIGKALQVRASAALFKGVTLAVMGLYVLATAVWRTFVQGAPEAVTMGAVGLAALAVNLTAALLLLRFRDGDANVRSVWQCSRNDALGNLAVLAAAGVVAMTGTKWADIAVAGVMALLFTNSALKIIRQANAELRDPARIN